MNFVAWADNIKPPVTGALLCSLMERILLVRRRRKASIAVESYSVHTNSFLRLQTMLGLEADGILKLNVRA